MKHIITERLKRLLTSMIIVVQVFFFPVTALAEGTSDVSSTGGEGTSQSADSTSSQTTAAADPAPAQKQAAVPSAPGEQKPTGAAANTYAYNEATGLWENDYYTWNPVTKQTKPKQAQDYSYNPTTGQWDTTEWYYSPEAGKYVPNVVSTTTAPSTAAKAAASPAATGNMVANTGPNSNNTVTNGGNTNGVFDLFFDSTVSNKIGQMSKSGNATVQGNTTAGNALTGDATALATVMNLLQSGWGSLGTDDLSFFVANIDGKVVGDLYVDPNAFAGSTGNTNLDVTIADNAAIHNDIDVDVASGNALVNGNTKAGNATSGDARAVVNLLNMINSAISANKSFIGVLNINGSLNGDILLPPSMLNAIIAATGPHSNNQISNGGNTNVNVTSNDTKTIDNNIQAAATTGNATVSNNTSAGNAKSGSAETNLVLLNLTGKKVVAENAILVFVNVLGSWVGLIFDAPTGTNSVMATGPGSNNTITDNKNLTVAADVTTNSLISNDVNVNARSGDATVSDNTTAGDATTGNAQVGVNALNMIDSSFDVSGWFGILFINVFGDWIGSFGVNTAAGNKPVSTGVFSQQVAAADQPAATPSQMFRFVPTGQVPKQTGVTQAMATGQTTPAPNETHPPQAVLSSSDSSSSSQGGGAGTAASGGGGFSPRLAGIALLFGVLLLAGERAFTLLKGRQIA